jgi:translocation and assembly module TamA
MLPNFLDQVPQGMAVEVDVSVSTGPLYRLRRIAIEGEVPDAARSALGLSPGDPAIAANVQAARARILNVLQESGHALATVNEPIALADDQADAIDLTFRAQAGPRTEIGTITFEGLERVDEAFARDAFALRMGELYSPSRIEMARRELLETGVFSSVTVRIGERLSDDGRISIIVDAQERPLRAVALGASYSTDLGVNLSASWTHRNLFGGAEQITLSAAGTGLWGSATDDLGYEVSARFVKPRFMREDQALEVAVTAVKQDLIAYRQTAQTVGVFLRREFSSLWRGSIGLTLTYDAVAQKGISRIYQLLALPLTATYDTTGIINPLLDPTRGSRASFIVTPTQAFGAETLTFAILQVSGSTYFDLSGDGRSVLAMRGLVGAVIGASPFDLPPDQRLYAGGTATVRGFRFQSIGPLFPDGDPIGGNAVDAATLELRQRVFRNFGLAAFIDAGQASDEGVPFTGTLRFGAGVGVRYYTPIGAVRVDVAVPLNRAPQGDSFALYIGLGQAF